MSYFSLATTTLTSAASSVTFSSIPTSVNGVALRDLIVIASGVSSSSVNGLLHFNGVTTGTSYNWVRMFGTGSGSGSSNSDTTTAIAYDFYTNPTILRLQIMDYSVTDKHKTALTRWDTAGNITGTTAFRWLSTNAITSVSLNLGSATFSVGTTISLYGVA